MQPIENKRWTNVDPESKQNIVFFFFYPRDTKPDSD